MKILTLEEAIENVPAINAERPAPRCSNRYNFVSTRNVVEKALEAGWKITNTKGSSTKSNKSLYGVHEVRMIHESQLSRDITAVEGFPTVNLINSHDCSKKFTLAIGYYRLICSNGLIATAGSSNTVNSRHFFNSEKMDMLTQSVDKVFEQYAEITNQIDNFKSRSLTKEECDILASYAKRIRYRFRASPPTKLDHTLLLKPRRSQDDVQNLWSVFNVIQENTMLGGEGLGKGIRRFQDDLRFNTEMWTGAAKALDFSGNKLASELNSLFVKKTKNSNN
jgi:hypothetical protein